VGPLYLANIDSRDGRLLLVSFRLTIPRDTSYSPEWLAISYLHGGYAPCFATGEGADAKPASVGGGRLAEGTIEQTFWFSVSRDIRRFDLVLNGVVVGSGKVQR
jgi:hypothetical protein